MLVAGIGHDELTYLQFHQGAIRFVMARAE